jgi:hypothetical protein
MQEWSVLSFLQFIQEMVFVPELNLTPRVVINPDICNFKLEATNVTVARINKRTSAYSTAPAAVSSSIKQCIIFFMMFLHFLIFLATSFYTTLSFFAFKITKTTRF